MYIFVYSVCIEIKIKYLFIKGKLFNVNSANKIEISIRKEYNVALGCQRHIQNVIWVYNNVGGVWVHKTKVRVPDGRKRYVYGVNAAIFGGVPDQVFIPPY